MINWTVNLFNNVSITSNQCSWKELPRIPILSLILHLPGNHNINFEGFEQYLIISTKYQFIKGGKGDLFDTINVLGKKKDEVIQVSYHRKGKLFQCKNIFPEWKPLILEPGSKKQKRAFEIKYSKALITNINDWHVGVDNPTAKVYTIPSY